YTQRNALTGAALSSFTIHTGLTNSEIDYGGNVQFEADENVHLRWIKNNQLYLRVFSNQGQVLSEHNFALENDNRSKHIVAYELLPDSKNLIVGVEYRDQDRTQVQTNFFKYNLATRNIVWSSSGNIIRYAGREFNNYAVSF